MQLAYTRDLVPGLPGMIFGEWNEAQIVDYVAGATILPGQAVEFNTSDGLIYPLKDTGTTTTFLPKLVGIALRDPVGGENSYPPATGTNVVSFAGYAAGQPVPVCRKGKVFALFDGGGTLAEWVAPNVWHSSTGADLQGVFTFSATATTAGHEIDTMLAGVLAIHKEFSGSFTDGFNQTVKVLVVELNLPSVQL
jgi:predicted RecA/RadA family phage recombinase